jgi:hypothetical protein
MEVWPGGHDRVDGRIGIHDGAEMQSCTPVDPVQRPLHDFGESQFSAFLFL